MEWVVVQEEWTAVVVTGVVITAVMDSVKMARNRTTEAIETKTDLRIRELLESLNIVSSYFAVKSFFPFAYIWWFILSMTHHCMYPFLTVLLSLSSVLYVEILAY